MQVRENKNENRAENTKPLNKDRADKLALKYKARTAKKGFPFSFSHRIVYRFALQRSQHDKKPSS